MMKKTVGILVASNVELHDRIAGGRIATFTTPPAFSRLVVAQLFRRPYEEQLARLILLSLLQLLLKSSFERQWEGYRMAL